MVSRHHRAILFGFFSFSAIHFSFLRLKRRLKSGAAILIQARQESNLQPPVLETGTLPIELLAFVEKGAPLAGGDSYLWITLSPGARYDGGSAGSTS
jgi:hypothetical protein